MTMRVLQIQLRSLTAMDIVAYGGAAAGVGVALWAVCAYHRSRRRSQRRRLVADHARRPPARRIRLPGLRPAIPDAVRCGLPAHPRRTAADCAAVRRILHPHAPTRLLLPRGDERYDLHQTYLRPAGHPEPAHGTATLPATTGTDVGTDTGTKAGTEADGGITVSFDHVGYSYDSADSGAAVQQMNSAPAPALTGLTFTAYPGQLTAIVGISGSGKSTAAALLAGTLTGYQGSLTLNDVKVSDPSGETLARTITLIGASSHLFAGTLRENLLMALPDDGQNGDVASDAANLSGGQLRLQRRPR